MNELTTITNAEKPSYLTNYEGDLGREGLEKDIKFPSLFPCRTNSKLHLAGMAPGSVFETVNKTAVLEPGGKFHFIPIFYYDSYMLMYDRDRKEERPVKEFTLDVTSPLGRLATARKLEDRKILDPERIGQKTKKDQPFYLNALHTKNFIVYLPFVSEELPLLNFPVAQLSFSRGEFKTGQLLGSLINARLGVPLQAIMLEASVGLHRHNDPSIPPWFGFNINNSEDPSKRFASEDVFKMTSALREQFIASFTERMAAAKANSDAEVDSEDSEEAAASSAPPM